MKKSYIPDVSEKFLMYIMNAQSEEIPAAEHQQKGKNLLKLIVDYYSTLFLLITLLSFLIRILFFPGRIIESFLICFLTWNVGVRGFIAFLANWIPLFADRIAASYGWPIGSSFQREIAAADGALGILGISCNWIGGDFWTATIIAVSSCWFLSELGGLIKMSQRKKDPNYQLNTSLQRGMRMDFVFSIVLLVCLVMWKQGF